MNITRETSSSYDTAPRRGPELVETAVGLLSEGPSDRPVRAGARYGRSGGGNGLLPFRTCLRRVDLLGKGSQGTVYLCRDLRARDAHVAVKVARTKGARTSLPDEVRALWALQGAQGVPTLKGLLYQQDELCGFVTHYRKGETLERLLRLGRIPALDVLPLAVSIGEAILAVARRGYIHRDIKPENLLCTPECHVQILDFGLACRPSRAPRNGEISGTLAYASPEQIEGRRLDSRSDLFSLGAVLYELATGRMFFTPEALGFRAFLELRERRLREALGLEDLDPDFAVLIRRLLVKEPLLRADVRETEARLQELRVRYPGLRGLCCAS